MFSSYETITHNVEMLKFVWPTGHEHQISFQYIFFWKKMERIFKNLQIKKIFGAHATGLVRHHSLFQNLQILPWGVRIVFTLIKCTGIDIIFLRCFCYSSVWQPVFDAWCNLSMLALLRYFWQRLPVLNLSSNNILIWFREFSNHPHSYLDYRLL